MKNRKPKTEDFCCICNKNFTESEVKSEETIDFVVDKHKKVKFYHRKCFEKLLERK